MSKKNLSVKVMARILMVIFTFSFMFVASPFKTQAATNISLTNPGFESSLTGWTSSGTSGSYYTQTGGHSGSNLAHYKSSAFNATTWQTKTGLTNGKYTLTAWVQSGGGQTSCFFFAKDFGGTQINRNLPTTSTWTQISISNISVTNGTITFGLYSNAAAGKWAKLDDVVLTYNDGASLPSSFLRGGDISELTYIEQMGGKFYNDAGTQQDALQIMKDHGVNIVRLRLYNDPGNPDYSPSNRLPAGIQNPTDILNLAARAKAKGMKIQLTFHYSDYWTNGNTQNKPHDWANLSYEDLKTAVYNFTYNFMNQMKAQGSTPEYVSLGNEIVGGVLFPDGANSSSFTKLAELLNQGYDAVKAVSATTKVIIHLDDAGNNSKYDWWFDGFVAAGGKFDVIGASYYPYWTGKTVAQIKTFIGYESGRYNKDVMIMETGYNWNPTLPNGYTGQLANNGPYEGIYPSSQEGQLQFMMECLQGFAGTSRCLGDLYWDPIMIAVPGVGWELGGENIVSNTTLYDFNGKALPALDAFK